MFAFNGWGWNRFKSPLYRSGERDDSRLLLAEDLSLKDGIFDNVFESLDDWCCDDDEVVARGIRLILYLNEIRY